jgi:hypothetical protein
MTIEQFRATLHQHAFQLLSAWPMAAPLRCGARDFVSRSPSGRTVIVHHDNERFSVLDLLLVSELEVLGANGQSA